MFARLTLLPSDFGMKKVGEDGSKKIGNHTVEPKKFVITGDDTSKKSVNGEIKKCQNNANDGEFADAFFCSRHKIIIAWYSEGV